MNKEQIVEIIAATHDITKVKANDIVSTLIATVQDAVVRGERVALLGFGVFEAVHTQPRTGHNPHTGKPVPIPARRRPRFTPGRQFLEAVGAPNAVSVTPPAP